MGVGDGDLDLVLGAGSGKLRAFERVAQGWLLPREGSDNPYRALRVFRVFRILKALLTLQMV